MKDIDTLLKQSGSAKPRRRLRTDFTTTITDYIAAHPRRSWIARLKEIRTMKWFTKPAIALSALAMLIVAGGTAYAAVGGWPGVVALFGGQHKLADGSRIVKVDAKNCTSANGFNITAQNQKQDVWYYRVKDGSTLTNEQIVQMVQGNCFVEEQTKFDKQIVDQVLNNPINKDKVVGGYIDSVVTAISDTSISLESVIPYGTDLRTVKQTFNHIAPDVLVYESPHKLSLRDIKVGDHVSVKYRATGDALGHSETLAPDQVSTDEQIVVMINKNTQAMTAAVNYQKYNMREFEQVMPCDSQPSGYCNLEQYLSR